MIHIEIRCDRCGLYWPEGWSQGVNRRHAHTIREELKKRGWHVIPDEGKDYCPLCWIELKEKRKKL